MVSPKMNLIILNLVLMPKKIGGEGYHNFIFSLIMFYVNLGEHRRTPSIFHIYIDLALGNGQSNPDHPQGPNKIKKKKWFGTWGGWSTPKGRAGHPQPQLGWPATPFIFYYVFNFLLYCFLIIFLKYII